MEIESSTPPPLPPLSFPSGRSGGGGNRSAADGRWREKSADCTQLSTWLWLIFLPFRLRMFRFFSTGFLFKTIFELKNHSPKLWFYFILLEFGHLYFLMLSIYFLYFQPIIPHSKLHLMKYIGFIEVSDPSSTTRSNLWLCDKPFQGMGFQYKSQYNYAVIEGRDCGQGMS